MGRGGWYSPARRFCADLLAPRLPILKRDRVTTTYVGVKACSYKRTVVTSSGLDKTTVGSLSDARSWLPSSLRPLTPSTSNLLCCSRSQIASNLAACNWQHPASFPSPNLGTAASGCNRPQKQGSRKWPEARQINEPPHRAPSGLGPCASHHRS
jgi:hypothetical protein